MCVVGVCCLYCVDVVVAFLDPHDGGDVCDPDHRHDCVDPFAVCQSRGRAGSCAGHMTCG